jgi:hypothetical protein
MVKVKEKLILHMIFFKKEKKSSTTSTDLEIYKQEATNKMKYVMHTRS